MRNKEHEEFLTSEEIRKIYGLEDDEDVKKFVKKVNCMSKGKKLILVNEEGDYHEN